MWSLIFALNRSKMKTQKGLDRKSFEGKFGTNEQCLQHLAYLKWGKGYFCLRCPSVDFVKGKKGLNRRCKQCGYEESPTSNTLFHKVKFDLFKAFGMIYDIMLSKKGSNSIWLAERYSISQNTAWLFRRKVQHYLKSSQRHPLTGEVHIDEFEIGGPQKGEPGRSATDKKVRIVIAVEIRKGKIGNGYAKVIGDFSAKSLKSIFDAHVSLDADIKTDGWRGYSPIKQLYKKMIQEKSNMGKNFPELHLQIRNFKNWIRGVHSYCDISNVEDYINEYFYRFNRRNHRKTITKHLLRRLLLQKAPTFKQLKVNTI